MRQVHSLRFSRVIRLSAVGLCVAMTATWACAAPAAGLYGEPAKAPSTEIKPFFDPAAPKGEWKDKDMWVLTTELSPAWVVGTVRSELDFFTDLPAWDLGAPSYMAYAGAGGAAQILANGKEVAGPAMQANWVLVWFSGAKGWTKWDAPWLVVLEKKPTTVKLDATGLTIRWPAAGGRVCAMPLYGYLKCPPQDTDYAVKAGAPSKNIKTFTWSNGLPGEVLKRVTWWSQALREVPIGCTETFSVDRANDSVTIRQQFEYLSIKDEWNTPAIKLAPLPPTLGVAYLAKGPLPLTFSAPVYDCDLFTGFGPYMGTLGSDSNSYTLKVLQYVNETEVQPEAASLAGPSAQAVKLMQSWLDKRITDPKGQYWPPFGLDNLVWSTSGADFVPVKYIKYASPEGRKKLETGLDTWFQQWLLNPNPIKHMDEAKKKESTYRFYFPQQVGNKLYYYTQGPGIGGDVYGDGGKLANNALYSFWCYGHYMGRWDVLKTRWDLLQKVFVTPLSMDWKGVGRNAIAELGDVGQPVLAYARMAYKLGDIDSYNYGCYVFAKVMVQHYVNERGGEYFWLNQPDNHGGVVPKHVYLTNLWGHVYGWDIGGPGFGTAQWTNRYVRFNDEDIARFHRDMLGDLVKDELDHWVKWTEDAQKVAHEMVYQLAEDRSHINPSMIRLRSLLQNLPATELAALAQPSAIKGSGDGQMLSWYSYVRAGQTKVQRLIPASGQPSPFVLGRQRDAGASNPVLTAFLRVTNKWPVPAWFGGLGWQKDLGVKAPKTNLGYGTGNDYPFGAVRPGRDRYPRNVGFNPLNWNTQIVYWDSSATAPANIALASKGSTAFVSEMENDFYKANKLIDGDYSQFWACKREGEHARSFGVDFGSPKAIARISVLFGEQSRTNIDKIEISQDGQTWQKLDVAFKTAEDINLPKPVTAKALRITMGPGKHMTVSELEVYAPESDK